MAHTEHFYLLSVPGPEYIYFQQNLPWSTAEKFCECYGTLAILDTQAEFNIFRERV